MFGSSPAEPGPLRNGTLNTLRELGGRPLRLGGVEGGDDAGDAGFRRTRRGPVRLRPGTRPLGLSESLRAASRAEGPRATRARMRAICMVSHDPPSTSPAMMRNSPMKARVPSGLPGLATTGAMNSGIPTTMGSTRHQPGGRGVVRRLTPSGRDPHPAQRDQRAGGGEQRHQHDHGEVSPQRRGHRVAEEPDPRERDRLQERADRQEREHSDQDAGRGGDDRIHRCDHVTWRGVAPTSRRAARRSSRRVAARRVAVLMRIISGKRMTTAAMPKPRR